MCRSALTLDHLAIRSYHPQYCPCTIDLTYSTYLSGHSFLTAVSSFQRLRMLYHNSTQYVNHLWFTVDAFSMFKRRYYFTLHGENFFCIFLIFLYSSFWTMALKMMWAMNATTPFYPLTKKQLNRWTSCIPHFSIRHFQNATVFLPSSAILLAIAALSNLFFVIILHLNLLISCGPCYHSPSSW